MRMAPRRTLESLIPQDRDLKILKENANQVADLIRALANNKRLLILFVLMSHGEMSVEPLADTVGLSTSALSQHLAKLRAKGLVKTRREAQTIFYRLTQEMHIKHTLLSLQRLF